MKKRKNLVTLTTRKCNDIVFEKTSRETGVPVSQIKEIFTEIMDMLREHIQSGKVDRFKLPFFGSFRLHPYSKLIIDYPNEVEARLLYGEDYLYKLRNPTPEQIEEYLKKEEENED
jgi:hypothetical protein